MKIIKQILLRFYVVWVLVVFSVFMLLLLPIIILPILLGQKFGNITYFGLWCWSWIFSQLTFIRYQIINRKAVDKKSSYIYTSNHTSFLDIPGLSLGIPTQFRPLAKKELLKIPVFGLIVRVACVIVDRSNPQSRKDSINKLTMQIREGISPLIFPEGTQNRTNEPLQPFYDGAFKIAIDTQTPILPIIVVGAGKLMKPSSILMRPGKIKVIFGKPIPVDQFQRADVKILKGQVYNEMKEMLLEHTEQ